MAAPVLCRRCGVMDGLLLLTCSGCSRSWHRHCLQYPISNNVVDSVERKNRSGGSEWQCRSCIEDGIELLYPSSELASDTSPGMLWVADPSSHTVALSVIQGNMNFEGISFPSPYLA